MPLNSVAITPLKMHSQIASPRKRTTLTIRTPKAWSTAPTRLVYKPLVPARYWWESLRY